MKILIIGSSGRIGTEILEQFKEYEIVAPKRDIYLNWNQTNQLKSIQNFIDENNISSIFICSGIMDSSKDEKIIYDVNFFLPRNIIEATRTLRTRIITFGTVMESVAPECNQYVRSKQKLQNFIDNENDNTRILSLKIHTIYGGCEPNEYMFLGQMLKSLKYKTTFNMSSGNQLREYHHVQDLVLAIKHLYENNIFGNQYMSSGKPIKLKDIAKFVFEYFEQISNLNIGSISHNELDNFEKTLPANSHIPNNSFREPCRGIVKYLENFLQ